MQRGCENFQVCKEGIMIKSKFLKLSHSDRWDAINKITGVKWHCEHCGCVVVAVKGQEGCFGMEAKDVVVIVRKH